MGAEGYASAGVWAAAKPRPQTASLHISSRVGGVDCGVWIAAELRSQSSVSTETSRDPGIIGGIALFGDILMGIILGGLRERAVSASEVFLSRADLR